MEEYMLDLNNSQSGTTKDMDFHSSGFKLQKGHTVLSILLTS